MKIAIAFGMALMLIACQNTQPETAEKETTVEPEKDLMAESPAIDSIGLNIDKQLLTDITNEVGKPYTALYKEIEKYTADEEFFYVLDSGIVFDFIPQQKAMDIFNQFHKQVEAGGNYLFLTELDFDDSYATYYDIVILKCADQFELVDLIGTDGMNYDIYSPEIIDQLKTWHQEVGLEICVADFDRVEAYMTRLPADVEKFCADVYSFCPDVIDQGYGDMDEMVEDIKTNRYLWMWWD